MATLAKEWNALDCPSQCPDVNTFKLKLTVGPFNLIVLFDFKFYILEYRANTVKDVSLS